MTVYADRPTMLEEDSDLDDDLSIVSPAVTSVVLPSSAAVVTPVVDERNGGDVGTAQSQAVTTPNSTSSLNQSYGFPARSVEAGTARDTNGDVHFRNNWVSVVFAVAIWLLICVMNVTNLVLVGLGK